MRCSVLPPEIIMHDAYIGGRFWRTKVTHKASDVAENDAYISGRSVNNIKCAVHNDLGWKNRTTRYNCTFSAASLALHVIFSVP